MDLELALIVLITITLVGATVNGALGYGFSSTTVPVALVFFTNRILNPGLVLIEVVINIYVVLINWRSIPNIWRKVLPVLLGLAPGVILGTFLLFWINPGWLKLVTFVIILPLILLQAAGIRKPIRSIWKFGIPFGAGVGVLYSVTTISGPLLAVKFNNQGLVKQDFRAAIGLIRISLSSLTAITYYQIGLYSAESIQLLPYIIPSVLIGIPIGAFLIRQMDPETFRRVCMSADVWFVGFGLSRVFIDLSLLTSPLAYSVLLMVVIIDFYLLHQYFTKLNIFRQPEVRTPL
ncbi:MAG TPA: sulfite exporter TauE/SafE family protein [Nitrospiria bacterium]|jgi:hypothetical protein